MMKKELKKKIASCVFTLTITLVAAAGLSAADVYADDVEYVERSWNGSEVVSVTKTANCTPISNCGTSIGSGWYYVNATWEYGSSSRLNINGTVNLVLVNGYTLRCKDGIHVPQGATLNIYCQPGDTGELIALGDTNYCAAIGGNNGENCGTVTIHGGKVTADAYNDNEGKEAAGIGGGEEGGGGNVTIYGGTVTATGTTYAAGIGSGDVDDGGKDGGTVKIYGGTVTAKGGCDAAGIGGGEGASGGNVEIWGGTVTAKGGDTDNSDSGAGIGSGDKDGKSVNAGTVKIHGGTVTAQGGPDAAGIGGGNEVSGGTIIIDGGKVEATGGVWGAGIGGGENGTGGSITIKGSAEITAQGGKWGAGIGGGNKASGGSIVIEGGTVTTTGGDGGAGIGGGDGGSAGSGDITIKDGKIEARGGDEAAGIGGGNQGAKSNPGTITIGGGKVWAYGGKDYGAGIGGGDKQDGGTITIGGGDIRAEGGRCAAGIGGGDSANGGNITIGGGDIRAEGGNGGAGIGGGDGVTGGGKSGKITINGGYVSAVGGDEAAGIGGGNQGDEGNEITINGGEIFARGRSDYGAGIGGGDQQTGGTITITGCESIEAYGGTEAAGIGGGDAAGAGKITISGGNNIKPQGGSVKNYGWTMPYGSNDGGAGIGTGSGVSSNAGEIKISGGNIKATGGSFSAGIGGGAFSVSGKIVIEGGEVEGIGKAGGAGIGTGSMCTANDAVDVTINGGHVIAHGGQTASWGNFRTDIESTKFKEYTTGAAIGAGGHRYERKKDQKRKDSDLERESKFSGTINLNGGDIEAVYDGGDYQATLIGGGKLGNSSNINVKADCTITIQSGTNPMNASSINLIDSNGKSSKVYKRNYPSEAANAGERVEWCKTKNDIWLRIEPCKHDGGSYTKNNEGHTFTCPHCTALGKGIEENHSWDRVVYTWSADYSEVIARHTCKKCKQKVSEIAKKEEGKISEKVVEEATCAEPGKLEYTAKFTNEGLGTATTIVDIPKDPKKHVWDDGEDIEALDYCGPAKLYTCINCGVEKIVAAGEHVWDTEWTYYPEPTCTEVGQRFHKCKNCEAFDLENFEIVNPLGHEWPAEEDYEYTWSEDNSTCTATRVCKRDANHKETEKVETTSEVTKPVECEEAGETTYTAVFTNGAFAEQTRKVQIPATGHDYGEPIYTWGAYYEEEGGEGEEKVYKEVVVCIGEVICNHDDTHAITEFAEATHDVTKQPKCEEMGETTYTAEFEPGVGEKDYFETQIKTVENIEPLGHDWSEAAYKWSENNSSVTGTRTCQREGCNGVDEKTVMTTTKVIRPATCSKKGIARYTGTFEKSDFETQTKEAEIDIDPNAHDFGAWKKLNAKQHQRVCKHNKDHVEKANHKWDAGKVTRKPTEEAEGVKTYTCTVCKATRTESIPKVKPSAGTYLNTEGNNQVWYKGGEKTADFVFKRTKKDNETFTRFVGVMVDGNYVGEPYYTAESGSVIIKLKPEYLEKLELGEHELTSVFDDGSVAVAFHVADREKGNPDDKKSDGNGGNGKSGRRGANTGDNTDTATWIAIMLVAALTLTGTAVYRRKRRG